MAGFYDRHILPHLIQCGCASEAFARRRAALIPRATGEVIEVGCGGGLNFGLYDPATATWHLRGGRRDGGADASFTFGPAGGIPVAGDWDGDGYDSIGVYMPDWGLWILRNANANGPADAMFVYRGGGVPVVARAASTHRA